MTSRFRLLLCSLSFIAMACTHDWQRFTSSSLDFNHHKIHRLTIEHTEAVSLVRIITALAEKRAVNLVFSSCKGNTCECSFKRRPTFVNGTRNKGSIFFYKGIGAAPFSFDTQSITLSSLMFSRITQNGEHAVVTMLGVPVVSESFISCPPELLKENRCRPIEINLRTAKALGLDISGRMEAEIISGIFAELRQALPVRKALPAPKAVGGENI